MTLTKLSAIKSALSIYMFIGMIGWFIAWAAGVDRHIVCPGFLSVSITGLFVTWINRKIKKMIFEDVKAKVKNQG